MLCTLLNIILEKENEKLANRNIQLTSFVQSFGAEQYRGMTGDEESKQNIYNWYKETVANNFPELRDSVKSNITIYNIPPKE